MMKLVSYVGGLIILGLGCSLAIRADIGTSPYDAVLVGLTESVGLSVGSWEVLVALTMLLGNALYSKSRPEWFALGTALLTGVSIDSWLFLLRHLADPSLPIQIALFAASLWLIALGTVLYLQANFAPIPIDRLMLLLMEKRGWSLLRARTTLSLSFVAIALLLHGPIGIGTVVTALTSGFLFQLTQRFIHYTTKNTATPLKE